MKFLNKKRLNNIQRDAITGSLFFLPWIIGFLVITLYPLAYSIAISFNQVAIKPGLIELEPMGWELFRQALFVDAEFRTKLISTVFNVAFGTPIAVVFALIISMLLNRKFKGRAFFRVIFFLPVIIMSGPVMSELMTQTSAMSINFDIMGVQTLLREMGNSWSTILLAFLNSFVRILWFCGVQIIIFLVALQKIDINMYQAASIDGATAWESFWKITLPYLKPIIMLNCIYTIIEMGAASDDPTNIKIVDSIRDIGRPYSFAAAMSWIYAACLILLIVIVFLLFNDWEERRRRNNDK